MPFIWRLTNSYPNLTLKGRKNRLPSRSLPEPSAEEKSQLLAKAVQAIQEDDVNKVTFL